MKKSCLFRGLLLSALLSAVALCTPNVIGKWSGTLQVEGGNDSKPAYIVLQQDGNKLAGSAGPNESEQHPFDGGKVEGNKMTFDVSLGGQGTMHFDLRVKGDLITGHVSHRVEGRIEAAKVSLKRVAEK